MEYVRAILVYVDAGDVFAVNIAAGMASFINNQAGFPLLRRFAGKYAAV
jgi:hypothetical protein